MVTDRTGVDIGLDPPKMRRTVEGGIMAGRHRGRLVWLGVVAFAVAAGIGGTALGGLLASAPEGYTGCLTRTGELVKVQEGDSPLKPCSATQQVAHLSAAITAGTGLTVVDGTSTLQLDPRYALPQDCQTGDELTWLGDSWGCGTPPLP
jgi:hypothetical protein